MRGSLRVIVPLLAAAALAAGALRLARTRRASAAWTSAPARIAYVGHGPENRDAIWVVGADGRASTRLLQCPYVIRDVNWSPDGGSAACSVWVGREGHAIVVLRVDGSRPLRCSNPEDHDGEPRWSPDGSRIAFSSTRDGNSEIYVMDSDCSRPVRLTRNHAVDCDPCWSPDGRRLAFSGFRDGSREVCTVNADGTGERRLTRTHGFDGDPAWSPDGSLIAFAHGGPAAGGIYVMQEDGSCRRRVTSATGGASSPAWSPDGRQIAYYGTAASGWGLRIVNVTGDSERHLTTGEVQPTMARDPAWLPDGRRIAFSGHTGRRVSALYCSDTRTRALTQLTRGEEEASLPLVLPAHALPPRPK